MVWVKKPIKGRFSFNVWQIVATERKRAEQAKKTGVSIARRAFKEFEGLLKRNQSKRQTK